MSYSDGNVIIFNGEIFNYVELKKELNKLGFHLDQNRYRSNISCI